MPKMLAYKVITDMLAIKMDESTYAQQPDSRFQTWTIGPHIC